MPIKSIRLAVVFLLALVMPLQGVAAASAGVCMSLGHHEGGAASQAGHDHGDEQAHDHGAAPPADEGEPAHCAPCVACCAAASIPLGMQLFSPEQPSFAAIGSPAAPDSGLPPGELDRPPVVL